MKTFLKTGAAALALTLPVGVPTWADGAPHGVAAPESHAPIMVMGDHMHEKGEFMASLRHMDMRMKGNIKGSNRVSDAAVLTEPNANGMPDKLRVVPQSMDMHMTMLGVMYAPSDTVTLLAMFMHSRNKMTLTTYQGMMGTTALGDFETESSGTGDTVLGALFAGGDTTHGKWHYGVALSLPTGATDKTDKVLTPMNMQPVKRLPYPMQLGSGSYDLKPSITYNGDWAGWRIGAQANAVLRLNDNDDDYRLGDRLELQGWVMKNMRPWASVSARLDVSHQTRLDGKDPLIALPVPTAQTRSHGGTYANAAFGVNLIGQTGVLANHRLALEWVKPIYQHGEGVQMKRQETLMLGWQKAF